MRIILSYIFVVLIPVLAFNQTNEGNLFYFGFMEHRDQNQNTKVVMITSKTNTSGIVSIPGRNWSQPYTVLANDVTIITLPSYTENIGSELVNNVGIKLTSLKPVSAYIHQYFGFRSEASLVLPFESIGNEYFTISYNGIFQNNIEYPTEFLIVAAEDETNVTITPSVSTAKNKLAGKSFTIKLNEGQTYQVQGKDYSYDLTGSHVLSDKKISVFSGNVWTAIPVDCGARDNLLEQMYPVSTWGKTFVAAPNFGVTSETFRMIASENGTTVKLSGGKNETVMLDRGQYYEFITKGEGTYFDSNHPLQIAQFIMSQNCNGYGLGDPAMLLLNTVQQTRDTVTLYNSAFQQISENYINVVLSTRDTGFVYFDGARMLDMGSTFEYIGPQNEYAYTTVRVQPGPHTVYSSGCGVIATAYGYGNVESYCYGGGAAFSNINANPIPEGGCLNDTVFFDTGLPPERFEFYWDLGNGKIRTESKFEEYYDQLGFYPIKLYLHNLCLNTRDTFFRDIEISLRQAVEAEGDTTVCQGGAFTMGATDIGGANYQWSGPIQFSSDVQFPEFIDVIPEMSGKYEVIGIVSGCATFPSFTEVEVIPTPVPYLGLDTIICSENEQIYTISPGDFYEYQWQDMSDDPEFGVSDEGMYWVVVEDEYGCFASDTVVFVDRCPTSLYMPNVFSPNGDRINDEFKVLGDDIISSYLQIFDRWGQLMFESTSQDIGWDGKIKGQLAPSAVYTWKVNYQGYRKNGKIYSGVEFGTITLIR